MLWETLMMPSPRYFPGEWIFPHLEEGAGDGEKEKNGGEKCTGIAHGMDTDLDMVLVGAVVGVAAGAVAGAVVGEEVSVAGPGAGHIMVDIMEPTRAPIIPDTITPAITARVPIILTPTFPSRVVRTSRR